MALQNEGTRGEVAQNFREQGNEAAREKRWGDAKEFYTKGIAVLRVKEDKWDKPEDPEAEKKLLRELEETVFVNRALCNLELSMFILLLFLSICMLTDKKTTALRLSTAPKPSRSIRKTSKHTTVPPRRCWLWIRYQKLWML